MAAVYLYFVSALTIIAITLAFFKTFTVYNIVTPQKTALDNWQIVTEKTLGLSFKLPKEAKADVFGEGDPKSTTIRAIIPLAQQSSSKSGDSLIFYVTPRADATKQKVKTIAQDTFNSNKANCPATASVSALTQTRVGMYEATGFNIGNCNGNFAEYFLTDGKTVFELSLFSEKTLDQSTKTLREQIINSFTFSK